MRFRHGLAEALLDARLDREVETLARQIDSDSKNEIILEQARAAARAVLDLARVRQVKIGLIERVSALRGTRAPPSGYRRCDESIVVSRIGFGRPTPTRKATQDPRTGRPLGDDAGGGAWAYSRSHTQDAAGAVQARSIQESGLSLRRDRAIHKILQKIYRKMRFLSRNSGGFAKRTQFVLVFTSAWVFSSPAPKGSPDPGVTAGLHHGCIGCSRRPASSSSTRTAEGLAWCDCESRPRPNRKRSDRWSPCDPEQLIDENGGGPDVRLRKSKAVPNRDKSDRKPERPAPRGWPSFGRLATALNVSIHLVNARYWKS